MSPSDFCYCTCEDIIISYLTRAQLHVFAKSGKKAKEKNTSLYIITILSYFLPCIKLLRSTLSSTILNVPSLCLAMPELDIALTCMACTFSEPSKFTPYESSFFLFFQGGFIQDQ